MFLSCVICFCTYFDFAFGLVMFVFWLLWDLVLRFVSFALDCSLVFVSVGLYVGVVLFALGL